MILFYSGLAFNNLLWQALAMLITRLIIVLLIFSACCPGMAQPARTTIAIRQSKVLVEFFYSPGCDECREIEDEVLRPLQELMGTSIDLRKYDILNPTNYLRLATLHAKSGVHTTERVSIYVDERIHMGGLKTIKVKLIPTVEAASLAKTEIGPRGTRGKQQIYPALRGKTNDIILKQRMATWTIPTMALAGLN